MSNKIYPKLFLFFHVMSSDLRNLIQLGIICHISPPLLVSIYTRICMRPRRHYCYQSCVTPDCANPSPRWSALSRKCSRSSDVYSKYKVSAHALTILAHVMIWQNVQSALSRQLNVRLCPYCNLSYIHKGSKFKSSKVLYVVYYWHLSFT